MRDKKLTVLITCRELSVRAGTQLYTRDVAEELRQNGHSPVVYSPRLGAVADELRRRGVPVVDDLERLGEAPDVIHGQHHFEAMAAMLRFPRVPALFVCHGWLPWQEAPPRFPSLLRYVAVDGLRRDRLVLEHGIAPAVVTVLPNFVDLDRFQPRPPLPVRPRRALFFSNQITGDDAVAAAVREACEHNGLALDFAGLGCGRPAATPEALLPEYDLVFARGRSALEAMAVGAAVVLCDIEGAGPLVGRENFATLRDANFGLLALRSPAQAGNLSLEIERYDPDEARRVRDRVRTELGCRTIVGRLMELYRSVVAETPAWGARHDENCLRAASVYLEWAAELTLLYAASSGRVDTAALRAEAASASARAEEFRQALEALERSPFSRLRARLLELRPVTSAYRRLKDRRER